jgi:DNA-binding CsgD family transcriptional regulator
MALFSADLAGALGHFTAVCDAVGDREPSRALVDCLACRSWTLTLTLTNLSRIPEAVDDGRRSLALARELGYPAGEALALASLSIAAVYEGDLDSAGQLARQAEHTGADIPSWITRACSMILTEVLTETGDLVAAAVICAEALTRSRETSDLWALPILLTQMAILDLRAGRAEDAAAHVREGLQVAIRTGGRTDVLNVLDSCGYLCAATRRPAEALAVWATSQALSRHEEFTDAPADERRRQESLLRARQALGPARARAAEERGTAMSWDAATEYALMLTAPGPRQPRAPTGPEKLSAREREMITLVAQGHTNTQIAAQLRISIRTVGSHLDRIRDKTGCRRRADLTRLALSVGLV